MTTPHAVFQSQIKVNLFLQIGHTWGCVKSPEKEEQKLDIIFSLCISLVIC